MQCITVNSLIAKYGSKGQRHTGMPQGQPHNGEGQRAFKRKSRHCQRRHHARVQSPNQRPAFWTKTTPGWEASFLIFVIQCKSPLNQRCSKITRTTIVYESSINRHIPCLPQELLRELFKLSYHHFSLSICKLEQLVSKWLTWSSAY